MTLIGLIASIVVSAASSASSSSSSSSSSSGSTSSYGANYYSWADQNIITKPDQVKIAEAKQDYVKAESVQPPTAASTAAMAQAHADAQAIRAADGSYDGGKYGADYLPFGGSGTSSTSTTSGGSSSGGSSSSGGYSYTPVTYYSVTASAGSHGAISPVGSSSVASGSSLTYTITPVTGYAVADVLVDGSSVGAVTSYTFSSVTANHTISATFKTMGSFTVSGITVADPKGNNNFTTFKAGYGFSTTINYDMQYATITSAVATMSNGDTCQMEVVNGTLQFVQNPSSPFLARRYYVPVSTKDGTFTATFTIKSVDSQGVALPTVTKTYTFTIKGTMYDDDMTVSK
jgi:hypothetical protein